MSLVRPVLAPANPGLITNNDIVGAEENLRRQLQAVTRGRLLVHNVHNASTPDALLIVTSVCTTHWVR